MISADEAKIIQARLAGKKALAKVLEDDGIATTVFQSLHLGLAIRLTQGDPGAGARKFVLMYLDALIAEGLVPPPELIQLRDSLLKK
jgi:hypothetical protein